MLKKDYVEHTSEFKEKLSTGRSKYGINIRVKRTSSKGKQNCRGNYFSVLLENFLIDEKKDEIVSVHEDLESAEKKLKTVSSHLSKLILKDGI